MSLAAFFQWMSKVHSTPSDTGVPGYLVSLVEKYETCGEPKECIFTAEDTTGLGLGSLMERHV